MGFQFSLLSDTDRSAMVALDVERPPDDRFAGFPQRITYLIDPDGVIRRSYLVGRHDIESHPETVLADLREALDGD